MFAELRRRSRIDRLGHLNSLHALLGAQCRQYSFRREWRLAQPNSHSVVDGIGDRWNGRGQRALARFLCAKRAFRIDALDDDALDIGRLR